ncbi:MAG TPA: DsrE family protein [Symbiobacteriaceae bacterium]|jgi:hypothetical protein
MKFAIVVHAGPQELARALHGLLYAQDLHNAGHEVSVIFDGAGTTWVKTLEDPENKYHDVYRATKELGLIGGVCEYCAGAFGVAEDVKQSGLPIKGELHGHPSLSDLVAQGYAPLIL